MWTLLKRTGQEFSSDNCMQMAAALAYYTIFSLPPLLVIILSVSGFFVQPEDIQGVVDQQVRDVVGAGGAKQIDTMIQHAQKPGRGLWGTVVGVALLLFGATGVMVQLQAALNQVWEVKPDPEQGGIMQFVTKRMMSLAMILAIAFVLLVSLVISAIISGLQSQVANWLPAGMSGAAFKLAEVGVSYFVIAMVFAVMYRYLPDVKVPWRDVWLGAGVTALLFVIAKWGLGIYLGRSAVADTYGAAGALALILIWIYYSGVIFLLGAEFTQVWSRQHGRGFQPEPGAVRTKAAGA